MGDPVPGGAQEPQADAPPSDASTRDPGRVARVADRARHEQARVTHAVEHTVERLQQARPRSRWVDAVFRTVEHDTSAGGAVIAGAVAFRVFLFLVPLVFVVVVGLGVASDAVREDPTALAREAGIGGLVAKAVGGAADLSGFERWTALVVGLFALFLGARALVKVLRVSYAMIWNVRLSRPRRTTRPALVLVGLTLAALVSAATVGELRREGLLLAVVGFALSSAVPFGALLLASWWLPRRTTRWQDLVPGAAFFAAGCQALHIVTVVWIAHVLESKTDTYGAIGAALAILLWAYLMGRLVTGAAVLDAALWLRAREGGPGPVPSAPPATPPADPVDQREGIS